MKKNKKDSLIQFKITRKEKNRIKQMRRIINFDPKASDSVFYRSLPSLLTLAVASSSMFAEENEGLKSKINELENQIKDFLECDGMK